MRKSAIIKLAVAAVIVLILAVASLLSNMKKNVVLEPLELALFTTNYKEQVTWRDTATGWLLAASDFFEPMAFGSLITPGIGGRVYFATGKGFITLQVMPAPASRS
jgi:hypothetical protein